MFIPNKVMQLYIPRVSEVVRDILKTYVSMIFV